MRQHASGRPVFPRCSARKVTFFRIFILVGIMLVDVQATGYDRLPFGLIP